MKRKYIYILLFCVGILYFQNELTCRNLCYWLNNSQNGFVSNIYYFLKPYVFPLLALLFLIKEYRVFTLIICCYNLIIVSSTLYAFLKHELWQYSNIENYLSTIEMHEIHILSYVFLSFVIYILPIIFFYIQKISFKNL